MDLLSISVRAEIEKHPVLKSRNSVFLDLEQLLERILFFKYFIESFFETYIIYGVIQSSVPPYLVEMRNAPWKPRIALSHKIYLKIIWRLSCCTTDYLPLNDSLCKMSSIHFWTFFGVFGVITHVTYGSSKKFKKR